MNFESVSIRYVRYLYQFGKVTPIDNLSTAKIAAQQMCLVPQTDQIPVQTYSSLKIHFH